MVHTSHCRVSAALFFLTASSPSRERPRGEQALPTAAAASSARAAWSGSAERCHLAFINTPSVFRLAKQRPDFLRAGAGTSCPSSPESASSQQGAPGQQRAGRRIDDGTGCAADRRHQHHPPARHEVPHPPRPSSVLNWTLLLPSPRARRLRRSTAHRRCRRCSCWWWRRARWSSTMR